MFIRVEDQSGNLTIWLNVNQIAKLEESRSSEEIMGYSVTTVDNKEYYSPDVKAIQAFIDASSCNGARWRYCRGA